MEQRLAKPGWLWACLRAISVLPVAATSLLILFVIPSGWLLPIVPVIAIDVVAAIMAITYWKTILIWVALIAQIGLFGLGLFAVLSGSTGEGYVPLLLLMFTMLLGSERTLTTTLTYSYQFSTRDNSEVREFNAEALRASIDYLPRKFARDSLILGLGFVLSLVAGSLIPPLTGSLILSDPSLYLVVATISLAALIILKDQ